MINTFADHWKIDKKFKKNLDSSSEKINNWLLEKYIKKKRPVSTKLGISYNKLPVNLRNFLFQILLKIKKDPGFPRWPIEDIIEEKRHNFMLKLKEEFNEIPYIDFWPKGKFCLVLTHDMDTQSSFEHINDLREIERKYNFKSSWNVLTQKYNIDFDKLRELKKEGCEIGCHGYNHDGLLSFLHKEKIVARIESSFNTLNEFEIKGFRAPQLQKSEDMLDIIKDYYLYDSSMTDTDIYSIVGMRSGCCTIFPYFIKNLIELPLTISQDYRMFYTLKLNDNQILAIWKKKIEFIIEKGGLVLINAHPDNYLSGSKRGLRLYDQILNYISKHDFYHDLPSEVAKWWGERDSCEIKGKRIMGSKRARIEIFN